MTRLQLRLLLVLVLTFVIVVAGRLMRTEPHMEALGYTECPFRGEPRVTVTANVAAEDTLPVRMHEEVHAAQCRELGTLEYRLKNFTTHGKLALEAPAYCAGARARLAQGMDSALVRERLIDDATASFKGAADPLAVREVLRLACPEIAR
jgi:hypothetical protein